MKHWNLDIIGYWVIGEGYWIKMTKNVAPVCSWKLLLLLISINWPNLVTEWVVVQKCCGCGSKKYSKMHPVSCTDTHHNVTDFVNHGMVKNTKTWISWKRKTFSLRSKKIHFWLIIMLLVWLHQSSNSCFVSVWLQIMT